MAILHLIIVSHTNSGYNETHSTADALFLCDVAELLVFTLQKEKI